jgi:hypothetical protein
LAQGSEAAAHGKFVALFVALCARFAPFRAPLMQSDKGGSLNKDQEIIALEIEKQLREKHESGGGCIYLSPSEWGERLGMSEGDFFRQFAELVDAGKVRPSVIEICG